MSQNDSHSHTLMQRDYTLVKLSVAIQAPLDASRELYGRRFLVPLRTTEEANQFRLWLPQVLGLIFSFGAVTRKRRLGRLTESLVSPSHYPLLVFTRHQGWAV